MGQLGNVEKVGGHLRHHSAGVMAVEVVERQALVLGKQVAPHVRLHVSAHDVPPAGDEELAAGAQQIQRHEQQQYQPQAGKNALRGFEEKLLREEVEELRESEVDNGEHRGAGQIGKKEPFVGAVIADEARPHPPSGHGGVGLFLYVVYLVHGGNGTSIQEKWPLANPSCDGASTGNDAPTTASPTDNVAPGPAPLRGRMGVPRQQCHSCLPLSPRSALSPSVTKCHLSHRIVYRPVAQTRFCGSFPSRLPRNLV